MDKVHAGPFTAEDVLRITKAKNEGKAAALSTMAHAVKLKAAVERMRDYIDAFEHAHETGNIVEAQGCGFSIVAAALTITSAAYGIEGAVKAELDERMAA
jgi:hypothetical protein